MIYNSHSSKGTKSPKDFMWDFDSSAHSPQALQDKMRAVMTAHQRGGDG